MVFRKACVEIIQDEYAVFFQGCADGPYGAVTFSFRPEIAKAGKKIESVIKIARIKQLPHIVSVKMKMFVFILKGVADAVLRQIDTRHIKTFCGQYACMTSPATG